MYIKIIHVTKFAQFECRYYVCTYIRFDISVTLHRLLDKWYMDGASLSHSSDLVSNLS